MAILSVFNLIITRKNLDYLIYQQKRRIVKIKLNLHSKNIKNSQINKNESIVKKILKKTVIFR